MQTKTNKKLDKSQKGTWNTFVKWFN